MFYSMYQAVGCFWITEPLDEPHSYTGFLAPKLMRFLAERLQKRIVLHGDANGVGPAASSEQHAPFFTGPYQRHVLPGIGHKRASGES